MVAATCFGITFAQGAFLVPSERCSIEEQSIEYYGWACNGNVMPKDVGATMDN
jgi:hypothetical protein